MISGTGASASSGPILDSTYSTKPQGLAGDVAIALVSCGGGHIVGPLMATSRAKLAWAVVVATAAWPKLLLSGFIEVTVLSSLPQWCPCQKLVVVCRSVAVLKQQLGLIVVCVCVCVRSSGVKASAPQTGCSSQSARPSRGLRLHGVRQQETTRSALLFSTFSTYPSQPPTNSLSDSLERFSGKTIGRARSS